MLGLPNTNGVAFATWDNGVEPNTLSNITTGVTINAGTNHAILATGLIVGATNSFVVVDGMGQQSNVASVLVNSFTNRVRIQNYGFLVSWDVVTGKTNTLWRKQDLNSPAWQKIVQFNGTNGVCSVIQTNDGLTGFFMVTIE